MTQDETVIQLSSAFTVQLVDDHQMMRLGLKALAQTSSHMELKWIESGNLDDALTTYATEPHIDLVLLDLNLPDSKGLQGLRRFLTECPTAQVAVFSATEDEFVVSQALAMGAVGFVPKSSMAETTLRLIESLLGGFRDSLEHASQARIATLQNERSTANLAHNVYSRAATLNPTQHRVLELVLAGMSNQEIANDTKLALGTIKNTVSSIMLALDVRSRSHLISVFT